jgi:hypothetical protein
VPKFRSKPKVITAVQFLDGRPFPHPNIQQEPKGVEPVQYAVWNRLHGSWIAIKFGDWVRVDDDNDTYPIDSEYMRANYDLIEEN